MRLVCNQQTNFPLLIFKQGGQLQQGSKEVCPLSDSVEYCFRDYFSGEIEVPLIFLIVNRGVRSRSTAGAVKLLNKLLQS